MKIGVVTYCHCLNYGAELQACALQRVLERYGHEPKIIDFDRAPLSGRQKRTKILRAIVNRLKRHPVSGLWELADLLLKKVTFRVLRLRKRGAIADSLSVRRSRFEEFWTLCEIHTDKLHRDDLSGLDFEAYIAGSDQIWNWMQTSDLSPYFLMFAGAASKKISYAASLSENSLPPEFHRQYQRFLINLDAISVREKQSISLLQPLVSTKVDMVLDPTLLLSKSDWAMHWSDRIKVNEPYIFSYTLNASRRYVRIMCAYARKHGFKIVNIASAIDAPDHREIINIYDAGPREFLFLLAHAQFVFTNSFHGTAFSLNFNIPFLSVLNPASETNSRVFSIAELLGVSDRVVMDDEPDLAAVAAEGCINFNLVNKARGAMVKHSLQFLEGSLNA